MLDLLLRRRSTRKFKGDKIPKEKIENLLKCALLSPSSRTTTPWLFTVIDNPEIISKLSIAKLTGSTFLKNAPLVIVVSAEHDKTDMWVEDTSIASTIIQLAAEKQDLGSCWVQIRGRMQSDTVTSDSFVKELLGMPDTVSIEALIAIGYKDEEKTPYTEENLKYDKVSYNTFNEKFFK
ncbi:MAG: hypothetical protein GX287_07970 [Fusobacteria bacterium]|nr:hypothetical protein [Fusobacteriota bacterium]